MSYKLKNMNESEKILYALNVLQLNSKDENSKKNIVELMNSLELKMGKSITEEEKNDDGKLEKDEKKEDE